MAMIGNAEMERLIDVVNRLQEAGLSEDLNLPQIIVVGSQSAGKSSVLENFVGRDFLPRGAGVVTKTPIVLQLSTSDDDYVEFQHLLGRRFTNNEDVRKEIERATKERIGTSDGISDTPIILKIYSPRVLKVTLIDLPGLTKVPIGSQPTDIAERIRNMVLKYVQRENSIILAVTPAHADLATSDAMQIAGEVDPHGKRTIAVITKLDMMDRGTDAGNILKNKVKHLDLGYIGVVNRSQQDIIDGKDIQEAVESEQKFFQDHPVYHSLENTGTHHLQIRLNDELKKHIFKELPRLRSELKEKLDLATKQQKKYEAAVNPDKSKEKLLECLIEFAKAFESQLEGGRNVSNKKDTAGRTINKMFYGRFPKILDLQPLPEGEMRGYIGTIIENLAGYHTNLFTPDEAFRQVVREQVQKFRAPIDTCINDVTKELKQTIEQLTNNMMDHYPILCSDVLNWVTDRITQQQKEAYTFLMRYIDAEAAFQNVQHEDNIKSDSPRRRKQDSPQFTKSVLDLKNDLRDKISTHDGWLRLGDGNSKNPNVFWFVLRRGSLTWYKKSPKSNKEKPLGRLSLPPEIRWKKDEINFKLILILELIEDSAKGSAKGKEFVVICENRPTLYEWCKALLSIGVEYADEDTDCDADSTNSDESHDVVPNLDEGVNLKPQVDEIKVMVDSYLVIVNKTIRDLVPKYISLILIQDTIKAVSLQMITEFTSNRDPTRLLDDGGKARDAYDKCQLQIEASREALRIINHETGDTAFP